MRAKRMMGNAGLLVSQRGDVDAALAKLHEETLLYQKRLEMSDKRRAFARENTEFETNRPRFYRRIRGVSRRQVQYLKKK